MHQRPGDHQPLGHSAGVLAVHVPLPHLEPHLGEQLERAAAPRPAAGAEVGRVEGQVLERRLLSLKFLTPPG